MPTRERRAIGRGAHLAGGGRRLLGVLDPLLAFSQGNPLTLSALVARP